MQIEPNSGDPADRGLVHAVEQALRAPSVHNTQPWRWRIDGDTADLFADEYRHLTSTDPDRRDLVISCGAALHHLRVALAAAGHAVVVTLLPDPEDRDHLARVQIVSGTAESAETALFPAIGSRRTDRRRMSHRHVPVSTLRRLVDQAGRPGVVLVHVAGAEMRGRFVRTVAEAAARQAAVPGYAAELELWTRRYAGSRDGVSAQAVAAMPAGLPEPWSLRRFPRSALAQPPQAPGHIAPDDAAEFLVVATAQDGVADRLRAGEAVSAVLLAATGLGLATTPLSQGIEVDSTRESIRSQVLHIPEHPQLIIRVGWPATPGSDPPRSERRDLRAVLMADGGRPDVVPPAVPA